MCSVAFVVVGGGSRIQNPRCGVVQDVEVLFYFCFITKNANETRYREKKNNQDMNAYIYIYIYITTMTLRYTKKSRTEVGR